MLFNTPLFLLFFTVFFLLYSFVFLRRTPRLYLILVSSLVFYAGWNYRFIPLLIFSAVVDYFAAQAIDNSNRTAVRKLLLAVSVAVNLGILAVFKYSGFVLQSVADFLQLFGYQPSLPVLELVLPVGISFYTFQSMSYTIDVYRGDMKSRRGLLQFTAALSFFPQLVAGPILRARQILPQFENIPVPTWAGVKHGFLLITVGLTKKTVADLLAVPAAVVFDSGETVSWIETLTGVLAFAGQIYGDFSGYSDMAIGIGLLLGFQLPENFRLPYFASSPVDFWRRWHITLSTWLRDYVYISLGGNRHDRFRNIFITMLLGGLWHGAAWSFLAWGLYHGALLVATHLLGQARILRPFSQPASWLTRIIKSVLTFYLITIGWVLFRAVSFDSAYEIIMDMHLPGGLPGAASNAMLIAKLTIGALVAMHLIDFCVIHYRGVIENRAWLFWPLLVLFNSFCLIIGEPGNAFIYFQF
jgi:D-alanyl-lipoteichoic acid acyltransferase DltB (MBOAT superfamily)